MKLKRITRTDSIPVSPTYYTEEGYLVDHPIVTTCGIFEYHNADGSVRRELRLPEEVFAQNSLDSYKGKPIVITHDAGEINKDNAADEEIGTILGKGYKDGDNVRCEIIVHDTDRMHKYGLKELSLGYSLNLEQKSGEWNGQHYDAIQRNILVNHLALVRSARAGENARLNIDGKDEEQGGSEMDELKKPFGNPNPVDEGAAHEGADFMKQDEEEKPDALQEAVEKVKAEGEETAPMGGEGASGAPSAEEEKKPSAEEAIKNVTARRDRRDAEGDPKDVDSAMLTIAQQDEDIDELINAIKELLTKYGHGDAECEKENMGACENPNEMQKMDACGDAGEADAPDFDKKFENKGMNMDSIDKVVAKKLAVCRVADKFGVDGVEGMTIRDAKKAIISKVNPNVRMDGKNDSYVDAMFDIVVNGNYGRGTDAQRASMFNAEIKTDMFGGGAESHRQKMIERQMEGK